jgi:uncharacterized membrane protein
MPFRKAVLSLAVLLLASVSLALAQGGTYTQIDVPGAAYTEGIGIDTAGDIVGAYGDTSGNIDGFFLSAGTYTTIVYPGSTLTTLFGINDLGKIVGDTRTPTKTGFLYDVQTQTFTTINRPGADYSLPFAINNGGIIGGLLVPSPTSPSIGFALIASGYKIISPPAGTFPEVSGVTASGMLFGSAYNTSGNPLNFSYSNGKYSPITIPNAPSAQIIAVNPQGSALAGYYLPASGVTAGFIYRNKTLTTLQFPGSNFTQAYGINAAGEVVGLFSDSVSTHGFTWTPPADAGKK